MACRSNARQHCNRQDRIEQQGKAQPHRLVTPFGRKQLMWLIRASLPKRLVALALFSHTSPAGLFPLNLEHRRLLVSPPHCVTLVFACYLHRGLSPSASSTAKLAIASLVLQHRHPDSLYIWPVCFQRHLSRTREPIPVLPVLAASSSSFPFHPSAASPSTLECYRDSLRRRS